MDLLLLSLMLTDFKSSNRKQRLNIKNIYSLQRETLYDMVNIKSQSWGFYSLALFFVTFSVSQKIQI